MTAVNTFPASPSPHRSRWGFHPCDLQTYRALKRLNDLVEKTKRRAAAQWRWDRKTVKRRGDRPGSPLPYTMKSIGYVSPDKPGRYRPDIGHEWVREMYEVARRPSREPVGPFAAADVEKAHLLLGTLEAWYKSPPPPGRGAATG